jgi:hypothetical protein
MSYLEEAIRHRSAAHELRELAQQFDLTRSHDAARVARSRAEEEERLADTADYRARISDEHRTVQMDELEVPMSSASYRTVA